MSQRVWFNFDNSIDFVRSDNFEFIADVKQAIFRKLGKSVCKSPVDIRIFRILLDNNNENNTISGLNNDEASELLEELRGDQPCRDASINLDIISGSSPLRGGRQPSVQLVVFVDPHHQVNNNTNNNNNNRTPTSQQQQKADNNNSSSYYQQFLIPPRSTTPPLSSRVASRPVPPPSSHQQASAAASSSPPPTTSATGNPRAAQLFARNSNNQQQVGTSFSPSSASSTDPKIRLGVDIVASADTDKVLGTVFVDLPSNLLRPSARQQLYTASHSSSSPQQNGGKNPRRRSPSPVHHQIRKNDGARIRSILETVHDVVSKHCVVIETPSLAPLIVRVLAYDAEFGEFVLLTENSNAHISQSFDQETLRPSRAMIAVVDYPTEADSPNEDDQRAGFIVTRNANNNSSVTPAKKPVASASSGRRQQSPPSAIDDQQDNTVVRQQQQQVQSIQEIALRAASPVIHAHAPSGSTITTTSNNQNQQQRPTTAPARNNNNNQESLTLTVTSSPTHYSAGNTSRPTTSPAEVARQQQPEVGVSARALADKLEIVMSQLTEERHRRILAERVLSETQSSVGEQVNAARKEAADAAREGQNARIEYLNNQFLANQQELEEVRKNLNSSQQRQQRGLDSNNNNNNTENAPNTSYTSTSTSTNPTSMEIQRELTSLRRSRAENEAEIETLRGKREMLEDQLSRAANSHEQMVKAVEALRMQVTNLVLDKNKLEEDLDEERRRPHSSNDNAAFDQKVNQLEATLQETSNSLSAAVSSLQEQLQEEQDKRRVAEHKSQNTEKDLEHYRTTWGREVTEKTQRIAELQAKLDAMGENRNEDSDVLAAATRETAEVRKNLDHSRLQIRQLSNQLAEERQLTQKLGDSLEKKTKSEDETSALFRGKAEQLDKDYAAVCKERDELKQKLLEESSKNKATYDKSNSQQQLAFDLDRQKKETEKLQKEKADLVQKLAAARAKLEANNDTITNLSAQTDDSVSKEEHEKVEKKLRDKSNELSSAKQSISSLEADLERLQEQYEATKRELETLQVLEDAGELRTPVAVSLERNNNNNNDNDTAEIVEKVGKLKRDLTEREDEIANLKTQLSQTHDQLHNSSENNLNQAQSENSQRRARELETELESVRSERDRLAEEKRDFSRQLDEMKESFSSIRERLQARISALQKQLDIVEEEVAEKEDKMKEIEENLEEEKAEHENTKRDLMSMSTRRVSRSASMMHMSGNPHSGSSTPPASREASGGLANPYPYTNYNENSNSFSNNNNPNNFSFHSPAAVEDAAAVIVKNRSRSGSVIVDADQYFKSSRLNEEKDETIARKELEEEEMISMKLIENDKQLLIRSTNSGSFSTPAAVNNNKPAVDESGDDEELEDDDDLNFNSGSDNDNDDKNNNKAGSARAEESNVLPNGNDSSVLPPAFFSTTTHVDDGDQKKDDAVDDDEPELSDFGADDDDENENVENQNQKQPQINIVPSSSRDETEVEESEISFGTTPADSGLTTPNPGKVVTASSVAASATADPIGRKGSSVTFSVVDTTTKQQGSNSQERQNEANDNEKSDSELSFGSTPADTPTMAPVPEKTTTATSAENEELDFDLDGSELPTPNTQQLEGTLQPQANTTNQVITASTAPPPVATTTNNNNDNDDNDSNVTGDTFTFGDSATNVSSTVKVEASKPVASSKPQIINDDETEESELDFDLTSTDDGARTPPPKPTTTTQQKPTATAMSNVPAPPRSFQIAVAESDDDDGFSLDSQTTSNSASPALKPGALSANVVQQALTGGASKPAAKPSSREGSSDGSSSLDFEL